MRDALRAVARRLAYGLPLPGTGRRVRVLIDSDTSPPLPNLEAKPEIVSFDDTASTGRRLMAANVAHAIVQRHIKALLKRCPQLGAFHHPVIESNIAEAEAFLAFCNDSTVLFAPQAREGHLRRQLVRWRDMVSHETLRAHISRMIALSDLESGVVERALSLRHEPGTGDRLDRQIDDFDRHYGAWPPYLSSARDKLDLEGDLRGRTLTWFFARNIHLLRGKRVLHVAPEETLENWMRAHALELQMTYETMDGFSTDADHVCDLTSLPFGNASYDVIICHRVLEHVLDDVAAYIEMRRVLSLGGLLNLSVPESPHLSVSEEWLVQDSSHHDHVRQYGGDLPSRIAATGFAVEVEKSLLNRTLDEHLQDRTYPLRHYLCQAV